MPTQLVFCQRRGSVHTERSTHHAIANITKMKTTVRPARSTPARTKAPNAPATAVGGLDVSVVG